MQRRGGLWGDFMYEICTGGMGRQCACVYLCLCVRLPACRNYCMGVRPPGRVFFKDIVAVDPDLDLYQKVGSGGGVVPDHVPLEGTL